MSGADMAILRIAGLPIRLWTAAAAPELFALAHEVNTDAERLRARSVTVARRIGSELVRHPDLPAARRAQALGVRRALHGGTEVDHDDLVAIAGIAERLLPATDLADTVHDLAARLARLAVDEAGLARATDAAQRRLLDTAWTLVRESPVAWRALHEAQPATMSDIANRVAAGEAWTTKRMRQRADFLWRMIARGATRATPRGWFAHIAPLTIDAEVPPGALPPVSEFYATEESENLHLRAVDVDPTEPDALLTMAPLHWDCAGHTQFWVVAADDPTRLSSLRVRTTATLDEIRRALAGGGLTARQLEFVLLGDGADARQQRDALGTFVAHLVELGVLTVSRSPRRALSGWHREVAAMPRTGSDSFVDVHRWPTGKLSRQTCAELDRLIDAALRILAVIDPDEPSPVRQGIGNRPRPLLTVVAEHLAKRSGAGGDSGGTLAPTCRHDWPTPEDPESPYARLHGWLTSRLDLGPVDLDADALAAAGVAHVEAALMAWPLDCHIRPLWTDAAGPRAVLDELMPTGVFDARFADGLAGLHAGGAARIGWYREFLRLLEQRAGGRFVELLVPPLSERAANAIRRPPYTGLWTGDPDARRYYGVDTSSRYVPLADITVRQADGRLIVEATGEPIWPVYHSARTMPPPWDIVGRLILDAGPRPSRHRWRSLRYSLPAWPGRDFMPRITVGAGALVLSCAQWRLSLLELWPERDVLPAKVRTLDRIRRRLGLPRWITVAANLHDEPRACDLESVQAIHTLDRLRRRGAREFLAAEMLPSPPRVPVVDQGAGLPGGSHAELLLRLPLTIDPAAMAARAAAAYRGRTTTMAKGGD